jgi:peptidoglycan/LPS O-acetylase OafA/YrhL
MRTRLRRLQPLLVCVLALGLVLLVGGAMESLHAQAPTVVR